MTHTIDQMPAPTTPELTPDQGIPAKNPQPKANPVVLAIVIAVFAGISLLIGIAATAGAGGGVQNGTDGPIINGWTYSQRTPVYDFFRARLGADSQLANCEAQYLILHTSPADFTGGSGDISVGQLAVQLGKC